MEIDFVLISDAVEAVNGKLYVMGGCWESVNATSFPTTVRLGIGIRVFIGPTDIGEHKLRVKFTDEAGTSIAPDVTGIVQIIPPHQSRSAAIAINTNLKIDHPGNYLTQVILDDREARPVSFEAKLALQS